MDWIPLGQEEYNSICQKVNYLEIKNRPGRLYQEVSKLPCTLESKVKFILQHWGWDGLPRDEGKLVISQINNFRLTFTSEVKEFIHQIYGLSLPMKKTRSLGTVEDIYGGVLRFKYPESGWKDLFITSKCLGLKFHDDVTPIGYMLNYNGFSLSGQQIDGWENPNYKPVGAWTYELYLGNNEKIYFWDSENSDGIGIEADSLISFFACAFGLIVDTEKVYGYATEEDLQSSAVTQSYDFALSLTNERYCLDQNGLLCFWCPQRLFQAVEEDLSFFEKDARQMWIRIRPYELEEIRRAYINNLYQLAGFFFGEESLDAAVLGGIARLDCCDEVRFSFGGYMDQTIQFALFRKGDEHEILSPENRPKV